MFRYCFRVQVCVRRHEVRNAGNTSFAIDVETEVKDDKEAIMPEFVLSSRQARIRPLNLIIEHIQINKLALQINNIPPTTSISKQTITNPISHKQNNLEIHKNIRSTNKAIRLTKPRIQFNLIISTSIINKKSIIK